MLRSDHRTRQTFSGLPNTIHRQACIMIGPLTTTRVGGVVQMLWDPQLALVGRSALARPEAALDGSRLMQLLAEGLLGKIPGDKASGIDSLERMETSLKGSRP